MLRHVRIVRLFWSTSLSAEMEYRLNFLFEAITSAGSFAGSLFTLSLVYGQGASFQGWPWHAALLVVGLFTLLEGVSSTWLNPNLSRIVNHVQKGTLDFVLLKPLDSQFYLSTRNLSPWGFPNMLFGLVLIFYAGGHLGFTAWQYLAGLVPLALSFVILYSLWYILGTLTIWFVKIYNVTEVFRALLEAGKYPLAAYPAVWQFFFVFVIPVAFLTTVPAESMRGSNPYFWQWLGAEALLATGLFAFSRFFWRFALRSYTSASS